MTASAETLPQQPRRGPAAASLRLVPPAATRDRRLSRGQTLFHADDAADAFFEVVSGTIRCCRLTHDGRRQVFRFADAGGLLGLSAEDRYGYSAEAVSHAVVRRRRLTELDAAMAADAAFRQRVLRSLRDELAATRLQMMLLGRMSAAERLATFLLALADNADSWIDLPMSRTDIADHLGLAIETVSRKFTELTTQGLIRLETPQRLRITDPSRLAMIAEAA